MREGVTLTADVHGPYNCDLGDTWGSFRGDRYALRPVRDPTDEHLVLGQLYPTHHPIFVACFPAWQELAHAFEEVYICWNPACAEPIPSGWLECPHCGGILGFKDSWQETPDAKFFDTYRARFEEDLRQGRHEMPPPRRLRLP